MAFYSISYVKLKEGCNPAEFEKWVEEIRLSFLKLSGCIDIRVLKYYNSNRSEESWDYGWIETWESVEAHRKIWGPGWEERLQLDFETWNRFVEDRLWVEFLPLGD